MKVTNKHNLPQFVLDFYNEFMWEKEFKENRYSVTELINPVRQYWLRRRHWDEIEEDLTALWPAVLGTMMHKCVEELPNPEQEQREYHLETKVPVGDDIITVSGKVDRLTPYSIRDWKFGLHSSLFDFEKDEWEIQLNLYRLLYYQETTLSPTDLIIDAAALDWREKPWNVGVPAKEERVDVWPLESAKLYLQTAVTTLHNARDTPDDQLPKCTPKQCWEKPGEFALMKKGRKSSLRNQPTEEALMQWATDNNHTYIPKSNGIIELHSGLSIVERPAKRPRCERYCSAAPFCNQYKEWRDG